MDYHISLAVELRYYNTYLFIGFKSKRNQKNTLVYKKHEYQLFLAEHGISTDKVEDIIFVGSLSDALPVPKPHNKRTYICCRRNHGLRCI